MTDPFRDLDAQVAEKVMGFTRETVPPDARGENGGTEVLVPPGHPEDYQYPPLGAISFTAFVPDYSTRLDVAWRVVEHLTGRGIAVSIIVGRDEVSVITSNDETRGFVAATASQAICLAALAADERK